MKGLRTHRSNFYILRLDSYNAIHKFFCFFSNTTYWRYGLYCTYANKDHITIHDMYEHLNKIYVQIGTKRTRDFNQVYIIIYFFNLLILCLQFS